MEKLFEGDFGKPGLLSQPLSFHLWAEKFRRYPFKSTSHYSNIVAEEDRYLAHWVFNEESVGSWDLKDLACSRTRTHKLFLVTSTWLLLYLSRDALHIGLETIWVYLKSDSSLKIKNTASLLIYSKVKWLEIRYRVS